MLQGIRFTLILPLLYATLCSAQRQQPENIFEKPPEEVDKPLRERISKFYQAHVDGKFRVADEVVAEDSKDAFFAADKQRYKGFEIVKIEYSDDFTKAKAVVACKTEWSFQGHRTPVTAPFTSLWKLEKGDWYWYTVTPDSTPTPFGNMKGGPAGDPAVSGILSADPKILAQGILSQVKVDKRDVVFKADAPGTEVITVLPGKVTLKLDYASVPGLTVALDSTEVGAGEKTALRLTYEPVGAAPTRAPITIALTVSPTLVRIPISVRFGPQAPPVVPPAHSKLPRSKA